MCFKNRISRLHYQPGQLPSPWLWPLLPLETGYRLLVALRMLAYDKGLLSRHAADVPVISIGNLTTGGTGKTPIVIEIARGLIRAGKTVVILSRGYGAAEPIAYGRAMDPCHGDEAYLMQEQLPEAVVIVGQDRVQTLKQAIHDYRPDYVLLDDGFQYLRLQRSVNILLIDGERLLGNGHLLPAGPLREPHAAIRRADLIFITKHITPEAMQAVERWTKVLDHPVQVLPIAFQPAGFLSMDRTQAAQADLNARPIIAVSGIARPDLFERNLREQGLTVAEHFQFDDHHAYTPADWNRLEAALQATPDAVLVTTEKDLPKLRSLIQKPLQARIFSLKIAPALDGHWFYQEFLTQMPDHHRAGDLHVHHGSSPRY